MLAVVLSLEAVVFGMIVGSILSSAAWRIPRHMSMFTKERSQCDACGAKIAVWDLVPVFSWFRLHARCRSCDSSISPTYARTETIVGAVCGVVVALVFKNGWAAVAIVALSVVVLLAISRLWRTERSGDRCGSRPAAEEIQTERRSIQPSGRGSPGSLLRGKDPGSPGVPSR
jgi:hypothetical protein